MGNHILQKHGLQPAPGQSLAQHTQNKLLAHTAQGYLVTCMDFRLLQDELNFMTSQGYHINYDQFILAGASLGFTQTKFPYWGDTLIDHMGIGKELHHFREIIFIDHMDCGAYRKFYPDIKGPQDEAALHQKHMQATRDKLHLKFPNMKFSGYLMNLKGQVEELNLNEDVKNQGVPANEKDEFLSGIKKHKPA